jgi:hypothetical protein
MSIRPFTFWRVLPIVGEAANCYFSRLVMDECKHLPRMYASEIGIDTIFKSDELLEHILRLPIPETDKARLRYWTPIEQNGLVFLAGRAFRRDQFRWARRLECRKCVDETPYHRIWWHLECFRTCPVHKCALDPIRDEWNSVGRWWPRFDRAVHDRLPDVELGDNEDTLESYIIRSLISSGHLAPDKSVGDFIDSAEFVGCLLGNGRQPSVPPFSTASLDVGYQVLKDGIATFADHFRRWLEDNRPLLYAYTVRDLVGWAVDYLLDHDDDFDPEVDDIPNTMLLEISDIIRAECGRALRR